MNRKQIFSNAWMIAKKSSAQFGGSSSSYLPESLKMAWAESKNQVESVQDNLISIGGKLWEKGDKRRIYFNCPELCKICGLETTHYKTGNISSAYLQGKRISNSRANRMINDLNMGLFYDLTKGSWGSKDISNFFYDLIELIEEKIDLK